MQIYDDICVLTYFEEKTTAETCNKAVMRITHAMMQVQRDKFQFHK